MMSRWSLRGYVVLDWCEYNGFRFLIWITTVAAKDRDGLGGKTKSNLRKETVNMGLCYMRWQQYWWSVRTKWFFVGKKNTVFYFWGSACLDRERWIKLLMVVREKHILLVRAVSSKGITGLIFWELMKAGLDCQLWKKGTNRN